MSKIQKSRLNNLACAVSVLIISMLLSGCMQSKAAVPESKVVISKNTLKVVNAAFYQTFVLGEWRYKGARNNGGTIDAYIQIPAPLDMSVEVQKSYLKEAICPSSAHTNMWNEVNDIPLSVHIYTHNQKQSLYVDCTNPLGAG